MGDPTGKRNPICEVTLGIIKHFEQALEIAYFDYLLLYRGTSLGMLWAVLSPLLQIGTYWLVFGVGIRSNSPVGEHPYIVWMVCGMSAWFFLQKAISNGGNALYSKSSIITRVSIPSYLTTVSEILSILIEHFWMLIIMMIIMAANGWRPDWYIFNILYYIFYIVCFSIALSMVTSVFTMVARDFQRILQALLRLLFYLTPILWMPKGNMGRLYDLFLKVNPAYYVVQGFRDSLLNHKPFWSDPRAVLIFWGITLVLYCIGCYMQMMVRDQLLDLI